MSGFQWTAADIPSQAGRRALITGANSGIGYYTALELARHGAHVLVGCRDRARGEAALARLRAEAPGASAEIALMDLASLDSVRQFAAAEVERGLGLDLLINNAGVMTPKTRLATADGFELQFGTNVLGHFALTARLMPALRRAAESAPLRPRVVTLSSLAHKRGKIYFDDLQWEKSYHPMRAYQQSKLGDLMFALEMQRRLHVAGPPVSRIMSVAAHPGIANTNLFKAQKYNPVEQVIRQWVVSGLIRILMNSERGAALPTLYAATSPEAIEGDYYGPQGFQEMRGNNVGPAQAMPKAMDAMAAARLWSECERLCGVKLL